MKPTDQRFAVVNQKNVEAHASEWDEKCRKFGVPGVHYKDQPAHASGKLYREVTTPTDKTISGAAIGMLEPVEPAHASEVATATLRQGAEKLAQELRNIVYCDLAGMRKDFGEDADSQFRQWAQNRAKAALSEYESQRPTPATASEQPASVRTHDFGEVYVGKGKPDSDSVGKEREIACKLLRRLQKSINVENKIQMIISALRLAATPSGGGQEWTKRKPRWREVYIMQGEEIVALLDNEQKADRIIDAHNATLQPSLPAVAGGEKS